MKTPVPKNIDEYISNYPAEIQEILQQVRAIVRKNAPKTEEAIKYAMPAYVQNGNVCYFAAYKKHLGFYPVPTDGALEKEMSPYKQGKGSIQFPYEKPMPVGLITKVIKWNLGRVAEKGVVKRSAK